MLTAVTYNCDPESLSDISPEAFVDALENELAALPRFRQTTLTVTFNPGASGVTSASWYEDAGEDLDETFRRLAEKAFATCCEGD